MKYCINYYKDFRYDDIIDEVIFNYGDYRETLVDKLQELKWKDSQRIIVDVRIGGEVDTVPILKMVMKNHNNFAVRVDVIQEDMVEALREAEIPFFYSNYADTPDEIYGMIQRGVSDVYITESLAFNIKKIGTYCKEKGVNVRMIPNVAQYKKGFKNEIPDPCKFFIRPEDVKLYESYADVFEIITLENKLSITYEIYRNEHWDGDLQVLIGGINEPFYNKGIVDYFGPERLKCEQKCMQEKCTLCQQIKELAGKFEENKLEIKTPKNKEWKHETESYQEAVRIAEKTTTNDDDEVPEE